jgi:hypothetical protein
MPEDADNTSRHRQLRPEDFASADARRSFPGDDDDARDDEREEFDHA